MEAREEKSLLESVRPPRLDEAGLEDCALSPEAIKEAFAKAAASIRSVFDGRDCVEDPGPTEGDLHDSLVSEETPIPCGGADPVRERSSEGCGCKVVGAGGDASDRVIGVEDPEEVEGGRACVSGLPEIEGQGREEGRGFEKNEEEGEEQEEEDRPVLAEVCI